jgi:hypothetical protein
MMGGCPPRVKGVLAGRAGLDTEIKIAVLQVFLLTWCIALCMLQIQATRSGGPLTTTWKGDHTMKSIDILEQLEAILQHLQNNGDDSEWANAAENGLLAARDYFAKH